MSLKEYVAKRDFKRSPEPKATKGKSQGELKFVIQKHDASRLHYDLRLEMDGVYKSWAVPKGPSLNPADKRLSMMVEDHPLEYGTFEGIIPEGNYGAGTVMVWDEGTYATPGLEGKSGEKQLLQMLEKGNVKLHFEGKRIKGDYALVRTPRGKGNEWLLIKKKDSYSTEEDVTKQETSVKTGRKLEEIARQDSDIWYSNEAAANIKLDDSLKESMPKDVKPMLATLVENSFDSTEWIYEIKWDGYRAVSEIMYDNVELYSRNKKSFNDHFPIIVENLKKLGVKAVLDGEVVAVDEKGHAKFDIIQNYKRTKEGNIIYYVFDILYLGEFNLTKLSLLERKKILKSILPKSDVIRYNDHIETEGKKFFDLAEQHRLEGIIAKKANSTYQIGRRSKDWLKIKTHRRQEAVIAGITNPKGGRKHFGALVLGVYKNGQLEYIGRAGGGFDEQMLKETYKMLEPFFTNESPFKRVPKIELPVQWLMPKFVCEVKFHEWTSEGQLRQPIFLGMREDKEPMEVVREEEKPIEKIVKERKPKETMRLKSRGPVNRKHLVDSKNKKLPLAKLSTNKEKGQLEIEGRVLKVTNLKKVFWPDEGYTKEDLLEYYYNISPLILPYLKDRPESLKRNPNGIMGQSFFQKNMPSTIPDWILTEKIWSEHNADDINYLICNDLPTLLYMANLGCIEINPWNSRLGTLENPDYIVIDLDPQDVPFQEVIEAAQAVKEILDRFGIKGFCKTSGSRGLHIYIPLGAKYDYDQGKNFAHLIASKVNELVPTITSLERSPSKRRNLIYLDYLQNRKGQTLAAPYCVRPRPRATVSTPLNWDEVKQGLSPKDFTIKNIFSRIQQEGDLFKDLLLEDNDVAEILDRINNERA